MIRILQVTDKICQRWGVATVIMNYYRNIDTSCLQFDFLVNEIDEDLRNEIEQKGGNVYFFPRFSILGIKQMTLVFDDFFKKKQNVYKAVHSHFYQINYWLFKSAEKYGIENRISHSHATKFSAGGWLKNTRNAIMNNMGLPFTTHYFACGYEAGLNMFGKQRMLSPNYSLIYNAINAEKFRFNPDVRALVRRSLNIEDGTYFLGIAASLSDRKNQSYIITIMPELLEVNKNIKLLLLGDGEIRSSLESLSKQLGVKDHIIFQGTVNNVCDYLQAIDCFLLPSKLEGLPLSVVEAEAAGLHCVLSDVITKEMNINNMCTYCALGDNKHWVESILKYKDCERVDTMALINNHHYNLQIEAGNLTSLYYSMK